MVKGDSVYLLPLRDVRKRNTEIVTAEIMNIGWKYITVKVNKYTSLKFRREDFLEESNYSPRYKLFASLQDAQNELEKDALVRDIFTRISFEIGSLSLEQLRLIHNILDEPRS